MGEASLPLGQLVPQKRNDLVLTLAETGEKKTKRQKVVPQKRNELVLTLDETG